MTFLPATSDPEDVPVQFDSAFNRGDVEAVLALFDDPATMRMTNGQVVEADRASLRAAFAHLLSLRPRIRNEVRRVLRSGDVALVLMDWTVTMRDPEGQEYVDRATATQVMKQQADGSWRLNIFNPPRHCLRGAIRSPAASPMGSKPGAREKRNEARQTA